MLSSHASDTSVTGSRGRYRDGYEGDEPTEEEWAKAQADYECAAASIFLGERRCE